jgi:hypothetical protein
MATIDITPTREEHARIIAYILASHLEGNPNQFGDYWHLTTEQEDALFLTWELLDVIDKGLQAIGLGLYELPKATKKKIILEATRKSIAE